MLQPIFLVTGPPAAGKSTICRALMEQFEFGIHIPVDDLREWVCGGLASPVGWTDETTRQFSLAEEGAADLAVRYNDAGFAVAIDHCQGPPTLEALIERRFRGRKAVKVAVVCDLETNLKRNQERIGKNFEFEILVPTIQRLNPLYRNSGLERQGWIVLENASGSLDGTVETLFGLAGRTVDNGPENVTGGRTL